METKNVLLIVLVVAILALFVGASLTGGAFWNTSPLTSKIRCSQIEFSIPNNSTPEQVCKQTFGNDFSCVSAEIMQMMAYYNSNDGTCNGDLQYFISFPLKRDCLSQVYPAASQCVHDINTEHTEPIFGDFIVDENYENKAYVNCCKVI